jgi:uncharacterized protein (TIGR02246 family)
MHHRFRLAMFVACAALITASAVAQPAAEDTKDNAVAPQLVQLVNQVSDALVRNDTATIAQLWTEDFSYVHSNGNQQSKSEFLDDVKTGRRKYYSITPGNIQTRLYGNTAVLTGLTDMKLNTAGRDLTLKIRFTSVCVQDGGKWRMAAWQSTAIPAPGGSAR